MSDPRSFRRSIGGRLTLFGAVTGALYRGRRAGRDHRDRRRKTIWLCKPGHEPDPCTPGLSTTVYSPTLQPLRVTIPAPSGRGSTASTSIRRCPIRRRRVEPADRSRAALDRAVPGGAVLPVCRVFAPMYRQVTVTALDSGNTESPAQLKVPLDDVTRGVQALPAQIQPRPPVRVIGHSQGSFLLDQVLRERGRRTAGSTPMLSAILLGANVTVAGGSDSGGLHPHPGLPDGLPISPA